MNIHEALQSILNPPTSPIPDDMSRKAINAVLGQIKSAPEDMWRSSPPGDLLNRMALSKQYNLQDIQSPPYQDQVNNSIDTAQHGINGALDALALGGAARPFASNPLQLVNGQSARLLNSGRGFSIFDRILNQ